MEFDLNSALAGANSAASLIDKVYYAPERHQMEKQKNDLAMRQGEAALDLTKLQTQNIRTEAENKKANEASMGEQAQQEQLLGLLQDKDTDRAKAGLTMLQGTPGFQAFATKHNYDIPKMIATVGTVRKAETAYRNMVSGKGTPQDQADVKQAVIAMYTNTTNKNIKPEDIDVVMNPETGVTTVTNKGVLVDKFNSPTELATLLHKDVSTIEASIESQMVFRASHGGKAELDYIKDRRETQQELSTLEEQALTKFQKQQVALAYKASPKKRAEIISLLQKDMAEVSKSKEVANVNRLIETQFGDIDAKVAAAKGNKNKGMFIADNLDSWAASIAQSPQVQAAANESGLDPLALSHKYLNDKFDKYLKLADVDVKEEHNRVAALAAAAKSKEDKTSSEIIQKRIDTNTKLLDSYSKNAVLDPSAKEEVARLKETITKDLTLLSNANYTPSGKKAEKFAIPPSKGDRTIDIGSLEVLLRANQRK